MKNFRARLLLFLGYIDVIARITTKNSNQNSPNLSNETKSENLQSENRKEFLDSVGIHPCPPPMIYRFDSAVNQSLDTMQDTIKFNKMGFILGVQRRISDTSGPIWMKL